MKTKLIIPAILCATLTGCASAPLFTGTQRIESATNHVAVVSTETNAAGAVTIVTNVVEVPVFYTNTVWTVSTQAVAGAQMVREIGNTVATVAPPAAPVVGIIDALLGLGMTILGGIAAVKTRLARKNADALETAGTMLRAVVAGVETANQPGVKEAIAQHASVLDVTHALDAVVQGVTKPLQQSKPAS